LARNAQGHRAFSTAVPGRKSGLSDRPRRPRPDSEFSVRHRLPGCSPCHRRPAVLDSGLALGQVPRDRSQRGPA